MVGRGGACSSSFKVLGVVEGYGNALALEGSLLLTTRLPATWTGLLIMLPYLLELIFYFWYHSLCPLRWLLLCYSLCFIYSASTLTNILRMMTKESVKEVV